MEPDVVRERATGGSFLWARQLHAILWKNVYVRRVCRHYPATIVEVLLMVFWLYGIQEDSVVREPLMRRPDAIYPPQRPGAFWNKAEGMVGINKVYFYAPNNSYVARLTREAFAELNVTDVTEVPTTKQLLRHARRATKLGLPTKVVVLRYRDLADGNVDKWPDSLRVSFYAGRLPFDVQVRYPQRLINSPEGPVAEEQLPEMNTLLPIVAALQQRHLEMQAGRSNYSHPLPPVTLQRYPYPAHIEYHDTKNYALVLIRFCIGMLIPFSMLVAQVVDEKASGMREMLRLVGVNDWVHWAGHYFSAFYMHTIISTLMMLFVSVKRNEEGKPFIYYSDPFLLFWILMHFCHSCLIHAMLLSVLFASRHSAVAAAMLYWTFCCTVPFLALEYANGQGYHYIERRHKLFTSVFPGMSLHWSFRVLERFEKFVEGGANWDNFYDSSATPDNVTLAEIVLVGVFADSVIVLLIWYLDNVLDNGPGIPKSYLFPFKLTYWVPSMTFTRQPSISVEEMENFEPEPRDQLVAIDILHASKDYNGVVAVNDVSFRVFENQITVLVGHNGAGKTTLLNMVTGFVGCSSGKILVGGYDIKTCTRDARESIGYCPQDNILFEELTVEEHVMFFAIVKGVPRDKARNEVVTVLYDSGLEDHRLKKVMDLSLGLQRCLCTVMAIVGSPKVIILDEPTANVDPDARRDLWELLMKLRRGCTVFLTTQHLDEAGVLGDRIAVMSSGRIRCVGSPGFLKQRFSTGYHLVVSKLPKCDVVKVKRFLRRHAPKTKLRSDSDREAIFVLGQIVSTRTIITMFQEIEKWGQSLGMESVGVNMTSLEDVLDRVGDEQHVHRKAGKGLAQPTGAEPKDWSEFDAKKVAASVVASMKTSEPGVLTLVWAVVVKRTIHVVREKKMPLFSWLMPFVLLFVAFFLERLALKGTGHSVENVGDTLSYTFNDVLVFSKAFVQADTEERFFNEQLTPLLNTQNVLFETLDTSVDITRRLLKMSKETLAKYVFDEHFGLQMTAKTGTVLWYNGEIQHTALLVTTLYNNARLRNVTGKERAEFAFEVTRHGIGDLGAKGGAAEYAGENTYRELLPKVLRSIFLPLCSSLMCSNFVLFPIAERALQVKHLHIVMGMSPLLYWLTNYAFDFLFYMGTALLVLPPVVFFQSKYLTGHDIQLIFTLNCLHGYAALPIIYLCSFMFTRPEAGFTTLAISTFLISAVGCLGSVFMEHYADDIRSEWWAPGIGILLQISRLLPSNSYSRGMTKILQLAREADICRRDILQLESRCNTKVAQHMKSLMQCCQHLDAPDPSKHAIKVLDVHHYSAYYEFVSLSVEGAAMFGLLLLLEWFLPQASKRLSAPDASVYEGEDLRFEVATAGSVQTLPASKKEQSRTKGEDTGVLLEKQLVSSVLAGGSPGKPVAPFVVVQRLFKAYGYMVNNLALKGLSFTVGKGECFGLLGVNGAGKTTTFRILTGELLPHSGNAYITNVSLLQATSKFRSFLGYCPEKDGLLDMMTGTETLVLFGRLRGVSMTAEYLREMLDIFRLAEFADNLVGTYSAGNKRKLSLCVSMLGSPDVLLLDEPYVGVGGPARRRIVDYMSALQKITNLSIVLTSHSMSDVEFLCNRIAIMTKGRLMCLGSLAHLKEKFGKGYTITVKMLADRAQDTAYQSQVINGVYRLFPKADMAHAYEDVLEFRVTGERVPWSEMFTRMARIKKFFKLDNFFITDTSLEQIFTSVTRKEASAAAAAAAAAAVEEQHQLVKPLMASTLGI